MERLLNIGACISRLHLDSQPRTSSESSYKILKFEEEYFHHNQTFEEAQVRLQAFLDDNYYARRLHFSLDYVHPDEFELNFSLCSCMKKMNIFVQTELYLLYFQHTVSKPFQLLWICQISLFSVKVHIHACFSKREASIEGLIALILAFIIDHHFLDGMNLSATLLTILGFMYMTYTFFKRQRLKWILRIITPALIGAIILFLAGLFEYGFLFGFTEQALRGGALYALIGGMIGIFNGIFIDWPPLVKKPRLFSGKGCLIGFVISYVVWFLAALALNSALAKALVEGVILATLGGIAGGFWRFVSWWPSVPTKKLPFLSWKGCLTGLICAFVFGYIIYLGLGYTPVEGFVRSSLLAPMGGITGGLVHFFKGIPPLSTEKPPTFSWKGCLIGLISAFAFGLVSAFIVNVTYHIMPAKSFGGALTAASFIGPAGAITGGISPYIFWNVNELDDDKLLGTGAILTLFGFVIQILPTLMSMFDISISH